MNSIQLSNRTQKLAVFVALNALYSVAVLIGFLLACRLAIIRSLLLMLALKLLPSCYHRAADVSSLITFLDVYSYFAILGVVSLERFCSPQFGVGSGTYVLMFRKYQTAKLPGAVLVPLYTLRRTVPILLRKFIVLLVGYATLLAFFPSAVSDWIMPAAVAVCLTANIPEKVRLRLSDSEGQNAFDTLFDPVAANLGARLATIIPTPPEGTIWDNIKL